MGLKISIYKFFYNHLQSKSSMTKYKVQKKATKDITQYIYNYLVCKL